MGRCGVILDFSRPAGRSRGTRGASRGSGQKEPSSRGRNACNNSACRASRVPPGFPLPATPTKKKRRNTGRRRWSQCREMFHRRTSLLPALSNKCAREKRKKKNEKNRDEKQDEEKLSGNLPKAYAIISRSRSYTRPLCRPVVRPQAENQPPGLVFIYGVLGTQGPSASRKWS